MSSPVIKIEVLGGDVEALAETLVALAAKVSGAQSTGDAEINADMPLEDLLKIVRHRAAEQGYKLHVVRADAEEQPTDDAASYEPKAVKRRGRRTKAEVEAARAAASQAEEGVEEAEKTIEEAEDESGEKLVLWSETAEEEAPEEEEYTEEQLEQIKRETIKKITPLYKAPGGLAKVGELLKDYKKYAAIGTIPAKFFPDIARRLEQ